MRYPMTTDALSRRVLRYAHAQGTGRSRFPAVSSSGPTADALPDELARSSAADGADSADGAAATAADATPLPYGTAELLERVAFPAGRLPEPVTRPLERALITAFGLQRAELTNPYFEHRSLPSVRSLFPVHAFLTGAGRAGRPRVLDVHRHALVELPGSAEAAEAAEAARTGDAGDAADAADAGDAGDAGAAGRVLLAGRYTRLPAFYGPLRGTLVELELGISLRSLAVATELFGLDGRLTLPTSGEALAELGLATETEWTLPLAFDVTAPGSPDGPAAAVEPRTAGSFTGDASLDEVLAVNRAQAAPARPLADPPAAAIAHSAAVGRSTAGREPSWAEVLWERGSGRMPRGLTGMSGRLRRVPEGSLSGAVAWAAVPPPGELLRRVAEKVRVTVAIQETDGFEDGVYRLDGGGRAALVPHRLAPGVPAVLERDYGYGLAPGNGCDVRHASAVWFCSVRQHELVDELGPGAWTLAQYVAGWIAQGLCLNAAAHGLYARPVRAFDGLAVQRPLGLAPDETVLLSVISGTPRFAGLPLDLRL